MEKIEQINHSEEEAKVLDLLNLAMLKRKGIDKIEISEMIDDFAGDLPDELKIKLENYYKKTEQEAKSVVVNFFEEMPEEMREGMQEYREEREENIEKDFSIKEKVQERGREIREGFMDGNLKIPNQAYSKLDLISKIDEVLENDPTPEGLKKVAYVSFDLNGLKAVNDLNSGKHAFGDEYLKLAAKDIGSKEAREVAKENGFNSDYIVTRNGGDEFGVMLKSGEPIKQEALNEFVWKVQDILWNNKKIANTLDFDNPNVLANFAGVDIKEVEKYNDINKFKDDQNIPKNYQYKGAISAGASRIYDALIDKDNKEDNEIEKGDSYERIVKKMMGSTLGTGDKQMDRNKKDFKQSLADAEIGEEFKNQDEVEDALMLSLVYTRTDSEKELLEENQILKEENKRLKEKDELAMQKEVQLARDIEALQETGATSESIIQMLRDRGLLKE